MAIPDDKITSESLSSLHEQPLSDLSLQQQVLNERILNTLMSQLLDNSSFESSLYESLKMIGNDSPFSRIVFFRYRNPLKLEKVMEWDSTPVYAEDSYLDNIYLKWFPHLTKMLRDQRRPFLLRTNNLDESWEKEKNLLESYHISHLVVVPVPDRQSSVGVLWLESPEEINQDILGQNYHYLNRFARTLGLIYRFSLSEKELEEFKKHAEETTLIETSFLSNISHEIRTPLNSIIGFSHLLISSLEDDQQLKYAKAVQTAGNSLLRLVNDILALSRIETGREKIHTKRTDMNGLFEELEHIFSLKVQQKNLKFIQEIDDNLPESLSLDEEKVRQILINLIGNAVKFTREGYIKLSAGVVEGSLTADKIDLVFVVEDTGVGIDDVVQSRLFESFSSKSSVTYKKFEGSGLGLAICKKLIDLMDGEIHLKSDKDVGTAVTVVLKSVRMPDATGASKNIEAVEDLDNLFFEPAKVLIVDDHVTNLTLLNVIFQRANLITLQARNGQEALDVVSQDRPQLILMDIRMPVMDGLEATRRLKRNEDTASIPIIALTAHTYSINDEMRDLFDGYLTKPVSIPLVIKEISRFLPYSFKQNSRPAAAKAGPQKKEKLNCSAETLQRIQKDLLPDIVRCQTVLVMKDILELADRIKTTGEEEKCAVLIETSEKLNRYVHNFHVDKIEELLSYLLEIINERKGVKDDA